MIKGENGKQGRRRTRRPFLRPLEIATIEENWSHDVQVHLRYKLVALTLFLDMNMEVA